MFFPSLAYAQGFGGVTQSGTVIANDCVKWVGNYTVADSGGACGGGGSSGLSIGTTTIGGGTNTYIEYNNSGVLGEYSVTGTGTTAVLSTSPTFTTGLTSPLIIGGTGAASTLTMESTSGSGTTDSIIFKTGSQATGMTLTTGGILNIASGSKGIQFNGQNAFTLPANDSGGQSIAIGSSAMGNAPASAAYQDVAIGYQALSSPSMTTAAINNVAVGYNALSTLTTGAKNVGVGDNTIISGGANQSVVIGYAATVGSNSNAIAIGSAANGGSSGAVAIGQGASAGGGSSGAVAVGQNTAAAFTGVALGVSASNSGCGSNCIAIGNSSLASATGAIAIGNSAKNGGTNGISIGIGAGASTVTGTLNVIIGPAVGSTTLTTGTNNILIGTNSGVDVQTSSESNSINIGNVLYATGLGTSGTSPTGSVGIGTTNPQGQFAIGNASAHTGQATCWASGGQIGYCTTVVGVGGACTCTGL